MPPESGSLWDHFPAGPPPPGVAPNFVDPPSLTNTIRVLDGVFVSSMLVALLVRLYVRFRLVRTWGWDDYFCIAASFGSLAHFIMHQHLYAIGFGRHMWDIPVSMLLGKAYLFSVNGIIFPLTILFAKLSILLLYIRIFTVNKGVRMSIFVGIAILSVFYVAMVCLAAVSVKTCVDVDAPSIPFCKNYSGPVQLLNACFNVATDFCILALPIPLIMKLHLRLKQKLGVVAVFLAGFAACVSSLARLISFSINYTGSDMLGTQAVNACFSYGSRWLLCSQDHANTCKASRNSTLPL
jgi:hypothetical protein